MAPLLIWDESTRYLTGRLPNALCDFGRTQRERISALAVKLQHTLRLLLNHAFQIVFPGASDKSSFRPAFSNGPLPSRWSRAQGLSGEGAARRRAGDLHQSREPQPFALSERPQRRWKLVEPLIPPGKRGGGKRTVIMREMYILSAGCQWRAIPKDLPPRSTL
jgi:hypothetical protein